MLGFAWSARPAGRSDRPAVQAADTSQEFWGLRLASAPGHGFGNVVDSSQPPLTTFADCLPHFPAPLPPPPRPFPRPSPKRNAPPQLWQPVQAACDGHDHDAGRLQRDLRVQVRGGRGGVRLVPRWPAFGSFAPSRRGASFLGRLLLEPVGQGKVSLARTLAPSLLPPLLPPPLLQKPPPNKTNPTTRIHNKPVNPLWQWTAVPSVPVTAAAHLPSTSAVAITLGAGVRMITFVNTVGGRALGAGWARQLKDKPSLGLVWGNLPDILNRFSDVCGGPWFPSFHQAYSWRPSAHPRARRKHRKPPCKAPKPAGAAPRRWKSNPPNHHHPPVRSPSPPTAPSTASASSATSPPPPHSTAWRGGERGAAALLPGSAVGVREGPGRAGARRSLTNRHTLYLMNKRTGPCLRFWGRTR